jgi:small subunit ribosomal protein S1
MSKSVTMDDLLKSSTVEQIKIGDVVEGTISTVKKNEVWVDLGPHGMGVVMRREIGSSQQLEPGQKITASVVETEMDDGYIFLSVRRAAKDRGWDELQRIFDEQEVIEISPYQGLFAGVSAGGWPLPASFRSRQR